MKGTIGERVLAAVISHQLGISMDRALKLYVHGRPVDSSWEAVGAELLKYSPASGSEPAATSAMRRGKFRRLRSHEVDSTRKYHR